MLTGLFLFNPADCDKKDKNYFLPSLLQVEQPKMAYNPQKFIRLVSTITKAKMPSTMASVPLIIFRK
jgi:hypothetical protein